MEDPLRCVRTGGDLFILCTFAGCDTLRERGGVSRAKNHPAGSCCANATQDGLPASLSYTMLTERLRGELGFTGVICTDSLSMQAIRDHYSAAEAAVAALNAGADLLLMPPDLPEAFDSVLEAVQNGTISEERLNESVRRILMLKQKAGLELDTRTPLEKMLDVFLQD